MTDKVKSWWHVITQFTSGMSTWQRVGLLIFFSFYYLLYDNFSDMLEAYKDNTTANIEMQRHFSEILEENRLLQAAISDIQMELFDAPYPMAVKDLRTGLIYKVNQKFIDIFLSPRGIALEDFINTDGSVLDREDKFVYYDSMTIASEFGHFRAPITMDGIPGEVHKWTRRGYYNSYIVVMWIPIPDQ